MIKLTQKPPYEEVFSSYFLSLHTFLFLLRKQSKNEVITLLGTMLKVSTFKLILNLVYYESELSTETEPREHVFDVFVCLKELAHGIIEAGRSKICKIQHRNSGQLMI